MFYNVVIQILVRCLLVCSRYDDYNRVYDEIRVWNDQLERPVICENNIIVIKDVFYSTDVVQGEIHKNVRLYTSEIDRNQRIDDYSDNKVVALIAFKEIYNLQEAAVRDYASLSTRPELNQMNDVTFQAWFAKQIFTFNVLSADYSNCLASTHPRIEFSDFYTKFLGLRNKDEVLPFEHFKKQQQNLRAFVFEIEHHKDQIKDGCYFKFIFEKQVDYGQRYRLSPVFYYKDNLLYLAKRNEQYELTKYPNVEAMTEKDVLNSAALFFDRNLKAKTTERSVSRMNIKHNGLVDGIERFVSERIRKKYSNYVVYTREIQDLNDRMRSEYRGMQMPEGLLLERTSIDYNEVREGSNAPVPEVSANQPAAAALPAAQAAHARQAVPGEQLLQPAHVLQPEQVSEPVHAPQTVNVPQIEESPIQPTHVPQPEPQVHHVPQEPQTQTGESEFTRDFRRSYEDAQRIREEVGGNAGEYGSGYQSNQDEEWETYRPELFSSRRETPRNIQETLRNILSDYGSEEETTTIESSDTEDKPKLTKGLVFGLVFAGVALVALLIIGIFIGRRAKRRRESAEAI